MSENFTIDFGGSLGGFLSSLFGFINELLRNIFDALAGFIDGINITVS
ncbi:MAG: hypothetical protein KAY37_02515 [Phycisphaerae bacterium]|nr:hypothetical protein [Phycisphaerae bacterium]